MSNQDRNHRLTAAEQRLIDEIAEAAAERAVQRAFGGLGLDPSNPDHVRDYHADRVWLRSAREGSSRVNLAFRTSIAGSIVTAIFYGAWLLIKRAGDGGGS